MSTRKLHFCLRHGTTGKSCPTVHSIAILITHTHSTYCFSIHSLEKIRQCNKEIIYSLTHLKNCFIKITYATTEASTEFNGKHKDNCH